MSKREQLDANRRRPMPVGKAAWQDLPLGGVVTDAGSSANYQTGDWRGALRPVINLERCTSCMLCWVYCPDAAIITANGKVTGIDYDFCKGCGICAVECPTRPEAAIKMLADGEE
jgi:pyruvate ferredoxin oxidoreductase delta subunit